MNLTEPAGKLISDEPVPFENTEAVLLLCSCVFSLATSYILQGMNVCDLIYLHALHHSSPEAQRNHVRPKFLVVGEYADISIY